jgi:hypothetical protein
MNKAWSFILVALPTLAWAGGIDIQKLKLKGAQHIKDLKYFQDTGLISARATAIEMQTEAFEKSIIQYRESKPADRNLALKNAQNTYDKFLPEFKVIAETFRDLVDRYQAGSNERNSEAFTDTTTKEKVLSAVEVGKQSETRALAAYNNRNYSYSAHLYLRALRQYHRVYELRKWPQLVKLTPEPKGKPKKSK